MAEDVLNPDYWRRRLTVAKERYQAVFLCSPVRWRQIEEQHKRILARHIGAKDYILDAGCGWGRLLELMPSSWKGGYHGVDIAPNFIELAKFEHPSRSFSIADLRDLTPTVQTQVFDWAVLISVRPMLIRAIGQEEWEKVVCNLHRVAKQLLYLEYDPSDEGSVE